MIGATRNGSAAAAFADPNVEKIEITRKRRAAVPTDEQPAFDDLKLQELFRSLGGGGTIAVYRLVTGQRVFTNKAIPFDPTMDELALDQALAEMLGGGRYWLKFKNGQGKHVGVCERYIDERVPPPSEKKPEPAEKAKADDFNLQLFYERQMERERRDGMLLAQQQQAMFSTILQLQENSGARQAALLAQIAQPHAAQPAGDAIAQVVNVSKLLESFGWRPGGAPTESSPTTALEFGLQVLKAPLTRIGDKVGEVLARQMEQTAAPTPVVTTQPTPARALPGPGAPPTQLSGGHARLAGMKQVPAEKLAEMAARIRDKKPTADVAAPVAAKVEAEAEVK